MSQTVIQPHPGGAPTGTGGNGIGGNGATGIWAPLTNVVLSSGIVERLLSRSPNLPGIGTLHGPSGYGKSMAAAYVANKFRGAYIECRSFFTKRTLLDAISRELGLRPGKSIGEAFDEICAEIQLTGRLLIVDEVDYIVETRLLELLRDIHEAAQAAILLIGEEHLPRKLQRAERFHNRVLVWQPAAPATALDARRLAQFYAPQVEIADDLLTAIAEASRHVVRRICVNIDSVADVASKEGIHSFDRKTWGSRGFYTGDPPARSRGGIR